MTAPEKTITLRPRIQLADESQRPTRAEIDLDALAANLALLRARLPGVHLLPVVKADAYGHGLVPVALRLDDEGVDGFGVALVEEALELREAGIAADIVVLNGVYGAAHREVLDAGIFPVVYDLGQVESFCRARPDVPFDVHLHLDTGMARLGVQVDRLDAFLTRLTRWPEVRISGVMTHLAAADTDDAFTALQLGRFRLALETLARHGHKPTEIHAANSAGALRHEAARFTMVRPGLALYGVAPFDRSLPLEPVMRLRTEIIALRQVAAGAPVGYDCAYVATRPSIVATVPLGYGDGLLRSTAGRGEVLVEGKRCPLVGRVSMDLTTIDVTDVPDAKVGSEVVLLGRQGGEEISAIDLAEAGRTIAYEVLTNVSRRVPRFYG